MEQKQRFVSMAGSGHFTMTELCRDFGICRKTGHKWVGRHAVGGMMALEERSRPPRSVTCRTSDEMTEFKIPNSRSQTKRNLKREVRPGDSE